MRLYFAWVDQDEIFDPKRHARNDETIFHLEIVEKEGEFAKAKIQIPSARAESLQTQGMRRAFISDDSTGEVRLLFQGISYGIPAFIEDDVMTVELMARPQNLDAQLKSLKVEADPIDEFFKPRSLKDQAHLYESSELSEIYCDRKTLQISKSDWFEGRKKKIFDGNHFSESLTTLLEKTPYSSVKVRITARWTQENWGLMDVGKRIASYFPGGDFNSYSDIILPRNWPRNGNLIGRSGFWFANTEFKSFVPPDTGPLNLYPRASRAYEVPTKEGTKRIRVKRYWYKLKLWLGWEYRQPRQETLEFTLNHHVQAVGQKPGDQKTIEIHVQNLQPRLEVYNWRHGLVYHPGAKVRRGNRVLRCKEYHFAGLSFEDNEDKWEVLHVLEDIDERGYSSFFIGQKGKKTLKGAVDVAKYTLAQSARAYQVSFEGSWEDMKDLDLDHTITLKDPRLPEGGVTGKVIHLVLIAEGSSGEKRGRVTLACSVGRTPQPLLPSENGIDMGAGIALLPYDDQLPKDGLLESPINLIRYVEIKNGPADQERYMKRFASLGEKALLKSVDDIPTRVYVEFIDLKTRGVLYHTIQAQMVGGYTPPQQIQLEGK